MKLYKKRENEIASKKQEIIDKWKALKEKYLNQKDLFYYEKVVI